MSSSAGTVFWITGLPRSGKTTLAKALCGRLRNENRAVVALDGDSFREACGGDLGYDDAARLKNAKRLSGMCRLISSQGLIVVCSTVSLFAEIHALNRNTFERYVEVLVRVPNEILMRRDPLLYGAAARGDIQLPGVNQSYSFPPHPEVVFEALNAELDLDHSVDQLIRWLDGPIARDT
jgi:cytidine diphosphoramidate kinase